MNRGMVATCGYLSTIRREKLVVRPRGSKDKALGSPSTIAHLSYLPMTIHAASCGETR